MIKKIAIIFLSAFLFGCTDTEEVKIPDNIISKDKMAKVFVDMHLLEATLNLNAGNPAKKEELNIDVFKKHGITKEKFEESYKFYTQNPSALSEVYDIVLNELSKLQAEVGASK
jgi:hypothetical protein